jgi:hypoxanthine phosphoribosyltransferase
MSQINDMESVLLSEEQLQQAVARIAGEIDEYYKNSHRPLLLVCILKGSVVFMGDLMKKIQHPVQIDFMKVSSYGKSSKTSGNINVQLDLHRDDLEETDVIIVEDIIDSGRTLSHLTEYIRLKGAHSVRTCTMLDKPSRREVDFTPDHVGFVVPDYFVVGYGLDYAESYRALPYIGILKKEIYCK